LAVVDDPTEVRVALGRTGAADALSFEQARQSPCLSCETSPCCRYLPVYHFNVTNLVELDYAIYLLNFRRIVLGLAASGEWAVYYRQPCRFLRLDDGMCSLHDMPEQPSICRHYNPYSCWYRKVLADNTHDEFVLVDRARLAWITERLTFDDQRNLVAAPEWAEIVAAFAGMPVEDVEAEDGAAEDVAEQDRAGGARARANGWRPVSLTSAPPVSGARRWSEAAVSDPCTGCSAYCCTTLVFPAAVPTTAAQLDYMGFCLGFPGVELGVDEDGWSLVVHTSCRHLDDGRCGLYGAPTRPIRCSHYDALRCDYRAHFREPEPSGFLRVPLERFAALAEAFAFDRDGQPVGVPGFADLHAALRR
jgi:hypothetical protein